MTLLIWWIHSWVFMAFFWSLQTSIVKRSIVPANSSFSCPDEIKIHKKLFMAIADTSDQNGFLYRVTGLTDRWWSLDFQRELRVDMLLLPLQRSQLRASSIWFKCIPGASLVRPTERYPELTGESHFKLFSVEYSAQSSATVTWPWTGGRN